MRSEYGPPSHAVVRWSSGALQVVVLGEGEVVDGGVAPHRVARGVQDDEHLQHREAISG